APAPGRYGDLSRARARSAPHRPSGGDPRLAVGRSVPLRYRCRLAERGDGPLHAALPVSLRVHARGGGGNAEALDRGSARLRGTVDPLPAGPLPTPPRAAPCAARHP